MILNESKFKTKIHTMALENLKQKWHQGTYKSAYLQNKINSNPYIVLFKLTESSKSVKIGNECI